MQLRCKRTGRYKKRQHKGTRWIETVIAFGLIAGMFATHGVVQVIASVEPEVITVEIPEHKGIEVEIITEIDWTPNRIERAIREAFPENPDLAVAIAKGESGKNLKATAYNPEWHKGCQGSYGVFQIACVHGDDVEDLYDVEYNIKRAREIYDAHGFEPWGAYTSGGYRSHY